MVLGVAQQHNDMLGLRGRMILEFIAGSITRHCNEKNLANRRIVSFSFRLVVIPRRNESV